MRIVTIAFLVFFNLFSINAFSHDSYINNRWNVKAGYSVYKTHPPFSSKPVNNNSYRLELNYGIRNEIETGVYVGYSRMMSYKQWAGSPGAYVGSDAKAFFYGVNCNYHILPLIIKEHDFRFDLYVTGKLGGMSFDANRPEYSIGGGIAFYLFKHFGSFVEYSYGKFYYNDNLKLRFGLSFKFKN